MSIDHQVLCDETAIIGIVKKQNPSSGQIVKTEIRFGKQQGKYRRPGMEDMDSEEYAMYYGSEDEEEPELG